MVHVTRLPTNEPDVNLQLTASEASSLCALLSVINNTSGSGGGRQLHEIWDALDDLHIDGSDRRTCVGTALKLRRDF